jgi:predicted outer membrane protein
MSDQSTNVAFDASAPADERAEALACLQKSHMPTASALLPPEAVRDLIADVEAAYTQDAFEKSINPNIVPYPSRNSEERKPGMQSVMFDQWTVNVQGDYWERPSALSFDALRTIVSQVPVLNAVIMTRVRQVQRFCRVAEQGNDAPGFEIRHRDREHQLTKSEQQSVALLSRFVTNCGWEFKPRRRKKLRRDAFSQFMAKSVRDSLVMDSAPIELEWKRNASLGIDGFYAVDGATIRLCTENGYRGDDDIFSIQLVEGQICTAYSFEDLVYEARNPRTDVTAAGYGLSETELLIRVVTGYLNAMTYNIKGFDSNSIPKGMLHLNGNYDERDLKAFKQYWNAMVKGINNAWTLPVMVSKDQESKATFEKFGIEFNEMYFSKWMTFLTSIICAIYGMSPSEINFDSFSGGNSSPLSGSDTAEKLAASKDSGLRPLMSYYENTLSDYLISDFSDDFVFRWTGMDPEDKAQKQEMRKLVLTVNEVRAEEGKQAMKGPLGDAPVNPALIQPWLQFNPPPVPEQPSPTAPDGTPLGPDGRPTNESGHPIDSTGRPLDQTDDDEEESPFGDKLQKPDFGKAFGLPPIYCLEEM